MKSVRMLVNNHIMHRHSLCMCDPVDTEKKEDDAAPSGPAAAGVSTFKPGMENGATDTAVGADGGGDTADGTEKKKEEGEQADPEGVQSSALVCLEYDSTLKLLSVTDSDFSKFSK